MSEEISARELRNDSGRIMRTLGEGRTFVLTRNGHPVGELRPLNRRRFVDLATVREAFRAAPPIDAARFRSDVDRVLDQDIDPRVGPGPHQEEKP